MSGKRIERRRKWALVAGCVIWLLSIAQLSRLGIRAVGESIAFRREMESRQICRLPVLTAEMVKSPETAQEKDSWMEEAAPAPEVHIIENCAITGYCACCTPYSHLNRDEQGRVLTASGQWVNAGYVVAVDPDVIPIGASVIIDNREYIALDTGVTGNVVDILMSHNEAAVAGCRYETVKWYVEEG